MGKPAFTELDRMGDSGSTRSRPPRYFLLHTEEGGSNAEQLAAYCNNTANQVSYHYTVRDGIVCDVVDTDLYSWSVLDANTYTVNLCFAGSRAGWTRAQWMQREGDIATAAWLAVQDCAKYKMSTAVYGPDRYRELAKAGTGISDHRFVTKGLGIGTHTDVGDGFPWDVFASYVNRYTGTPPTQEDAPMSAAEVQDLKNYIDKRITDPMGSDLKDVRQQITGGRDKGQYPGFPQIGDRTVVDALALIGEKLEIPGFKAPAKGGK